MIIPKLQVDHREVPFDSGSPNIPVDVLSEDFVASHTEMDIDEIKKFNAERDATSSQSDSESDPTWEPEDMESVNTLVRGLNITPDRRSNRSYVTKDAKERLAVLTQWTCPITKESPISNLQRVIEVAHVVSKSLKGEELIKLEFIIGCKYKGLHIDTTKNLMHMRVDIHRAYDGAAFMLVPDSDSMQKILDHLLEIEETLEKNPKYYGDVNNLKSYKSILKRKRYVYKLVPLLWSDVSKKKKCPQIAIPGDIPGTFYSLFEENITKRVYSYEKLPEFTSHINPFFAVADCVRKLPNFFGNLPSEFLNDKGPLSKLSLISRLWKYTTAPDAWENNLYEKRKPSPDRQDPDISGDPSTPTRPSQTRSGGNFRKGGGGGDNNTKAVYKGKGNSSAYQWNSSYRMNVQYESLSDRVSAASSESSDTEPLTEEVPRDFSPVDNQEYVNEWCHNYRSVQNSLTHPPIDIYV